MTLNQYDVAALRAHAHDLAKAFDARLIEDARIKPEEAISIPDPRRIALVGAIVDETTYAVALHELGHLASPTGFVRNVIEGGTRADILRIEEHAAWDWARHYALDWTPAMEALRAWALGTYGAAAATDAGQAPTAAPIPAPPLTPKATKTINWKNWSK